MVGMGLLDVIGLGATARSGMLSATEHGIASPWAPEGNMQSIVWSDLLGAEVADSLPMTRAEAISIPAVSKARNLLVSTVAKFPLVAARYERATGADTDTTTEHPWLFRTKGPVPPHARMAWTIDDAIFHGTSLWLVERGAEQDGRRPITAAEWCPWDWWSYENHDGRMRFVVRNGGVGEPRPLEPDEYLLFDFPFEGLLHIGARTLRGARDLERAWIGRARNPVPVLNLKRSGDYVEQTPGEAKQMVQDWAKARLDPLGAVGSTPEGVELEVLGDVPVDLMIEGRNAVRTDVGSFLNVRVAMLDGTIGVDSLTYTTKDGERNAFFEFDLPFWTDPIEARLSLDDVVPRGQRVRFQKYQETPEPIGPEVED